MENNFFITANIFQSITSAVFEDHRYLSILEGLGNTLIITLCATLIGIALGMFVALVKHFSSANKKLWIFNKICDLYITIIRGTPVVVQLLILSTVVFASMKEAIPVAIIGFGLNSGAYVAEIIRAGISAVDKGQDEAGRSLGLSKIQTMRYIILPQAIKNILPALGNEFIVLLKETSIAGYIAVHDLTKAGELIKNNTYDGFVYFVIAIIYLVVVMGMTALLRMAERRLRSSEH